MGRGKDHAQVLLAQHLADRIELMVSRGLERDLDQSAADERERVLAAASEYPRPRGSSTRAQSLFNAMNTAVTAHLPDFPRTTQDTGDIWQLAEAAAAGAQVFATWDERLLSTVAPLALKADHAPELARMRVLDPNHLEVRLDELAHAAAYSPDDLQGSEFTTVRAGSDSGTVLMEFLQHRMGETKTEFKKLHRDAPGRAGT